MAYKEKYPLDITPQGDTVQDSIRKNRDEMLNIAKGIDLKAGGGGNSGGGVLRNRVLSGKVGNGEYSFLIGDNLSVIIDGSQTPVLLAFADGFDDNGSVDYMATVTTKMSAWSLPARSTSYLYVERSATGALSYGSTTVEPLRQPNTPKAEMDKMYYNTIADKMYLYNGVQWKLVQRIIVAIVVTDSTSIKSIKYYRPGFSGDVMADKSITSEKIGDKEIKGANIADEQIESKHLAKSINDLFAAVKKDIEDLKPKIDSVLSKAYPVGAIYCSTVETNPHDLFGFGTWEYIEQGRVLLSQGNKYSAGSTGGAETHTLTVAEMPSHKHGDTTGEGGAHTHTGVAKTSGEHTHTCEIADYGSDFKTRKFWEEKQSSRTALKTTEIMNIKSGGEHTHDIQIDNSKNHTHIINSEGGGQAHNIMQPYLSVYMWKRVA
jgi:microcystin-dependent protein|nr:MAG TPA: baseplate wedge protein [Caudoviricetes sp.]